MEPWGPHDFTFLSRFECKFEFIDKFEYTVMFIPVAQQIQNMFHLVSSEFLGKLAECLELNRVYFIGARK
jgi:hypothetical protein